MKPISVLILRIPLFSLPIFFLSASVHSSLAWGLVTLLSGSALFETRARETGRLNRFPFPYGGCTWIRTCVAQTKLLAMGRKAWKILTPTGYYAWNINYPWFSIFLNSLSREQKSPSKCLLQITRMSFTLIRKLDFLLSLVKRSALSSKSSRDFPRHLTNPRYDEIFSRTAVYRI